LFFSGKSFGVRLIRSSAWSIAVSIPIFALYIWFWQNTDPQASLIRWSGSYAKELHPADLADGNQFGFCSRRRRIFGIGDSERIA
jgi:hypothetical protein